MQETKQVVVNGIEVDVEKASRLLKRLIVKERTNIKSRQYNDTEMVKQIRKMIEEEVQCY